MLFLIFLWIFLVFASFWYRRKFSRRDFLLSKTPSLQSYPLLHHSPHFINKNPITVFTFIKELHQKLGETFHTSYGRFDEAFTFTTNLKIVEALLTNHDELAKTVDYELLVPWTGRGLLMSSDKKWFQRRKVHPF
jgi:cytochrome P450 family 4